MKKSITVLLLFISTISYSQIHFEIENIDISNVIEVINEDLIYEGFGEGPWIDIECAIINNTKDTIRLFFKDSEFQIIFYYDNKQFKKNPFITPFYKTDTMIIEPNQKFNFNLGTPYLLGCDFYKWSRISLVNIYKIDHSKEVIATLPTLKVRYKDKNIDITTSGIKKVTFIETP